MEGEKQFRCDICDRIFKEEKSLEMHNSTKHSSNIKEEKTGKTDYKKIRNWGVFIIIFGLIAYGIIWLVLNSGSFEDIPANEINIGSHQNIALHIHSDLKININGEETQIPSNIGVGNGVMRPVHTHDSSGEIHIEGPYKRDYAIEEFFQVWGKTFNSKCIFDYCTDNGELNMYVNGIENSEFENYVMKDDDLILIEYTSNS